MKQLDLYITEKLKLNKDSKDENDPTVRDPKNDGKVILTLRKSHNGGSLIDRTLEIYQLKNGYKGVLWNSGKMHWKSAPNIPMDIYRAKTIDQIKDKFNFE